MRQAGLHGRPELRLRRQLLLQHLRLAAGVVDFVLLLPCCALASWAADLENHLDGVLFLGHCFVVPYGGRTSTALSAPELIAM